MLLLFWTGNAALSGRKSLGEANCFCGAKGLLLLMVC